jgi:hypothetical protein
MEVIFKPRPAIGQLYSEQCKLFRIEKVGDRSFYLFLFFFFQLLFHIFTLTLSLISFLRHKTLKHLCHFLSSTTGGPDVCFDLSGEHCGIILPTLNWWPTDAYSFCCWIRLESFLDPVILPSPFASGKPTSPRREYLPVLFSFGNEDEFGMDLVFVQNQLALVAKGGKGKRTLQGR